MRAWRAISGLLGKAKGGWERFRLVGKARESGKATSRALRKYERNYIDLGPRIRGESEGGMERFRLVGKARESGKVTSRALRKY